MDLTSRQTERVTRVFLLAEQETARSGHTRLGTVHLLLALVRDERDHGGGLLAGLDLEQARAETAAYGVGYRDPGYRPLSPGAVAAIAAALREADGAPDATVGVRHLLLGVLADDTEDAARILRALHIDVDGVVVAARRDLEADTSPRPHAAAVPVVSQLDRVVAALGRLGRASTPSTAGP
ncbi:MAG TPA: Clp protease N-terminal domain-containing protein [Actinomycetospora sp.]|nr:Clp protease N-terminal domain-containing protein [Actinomycetospora sp.]